MVKPLGVIVKVVKLLTGRVDHSKTLAAKAVCVANATNIAAVIAAILTAATTVIHWTATVLGLGRALSDVNYAGISHRIFLIVHSVLLLFLNCELTLITVYAT